MGREHSGTFHLLGRTLSMLVWLVEGLEDDFCLWNSLQGALQQSRVCIGSTPATAGGAKSRVFIGEAAYRGRPLSRVMFFKVRFEGRFLISSCHDPISCKYLVCIIPLLFLPGQQRWSLQAVPWVHWCHLFLHQLPRKAVLRVTPEVPSDTEEQKDVFGGRVAKHFCHDELLQVTVTPQHDHVLLVILVRHFSITNMFSNMGHSKPFNTTMKTSQKMV